jgi:hypothetical protein
MKPWIGADYAQQDRKILVLGESHFLENSTFHHDAPAWYAGTDPERFVGLDWAHTRALIGKGVDSQWRGMGRSKVMYRHIDAALCDAIGERENPRSAFHRIAFMNYFQRPAQKRGKSIEIIELDRLHSAAVVHEVIRIIAPSLVIFCSKLAWCAAAGKGVMKAYEPDAVRFAFTAHPTTSWWHRPMAKYGGQSGRDQFSEAVRNTARLHSQPPSTP